MADIHNGEFNTVSIEDKTSGVDMTVNADGSTTHALVDGKKITYSAAFTGLVPAAAATDVFTILGSATKTIRITRIVVSVSTTAGSGVAENISLVKRSTADSAGTSTTATLVPHDSADGAATSVIRGYTANPTLGTAVGTLRAVRSAATTAGSIVQEIEWIFGNRPAKAIVLRGTSEQLCVNFGGVTITGPVSCFSVEWTEE